MLKLFNRFDSQSIFSNFDLKCVAVARTHTYIHSTITIPLSPYPFHCSCQLFERMRVCVCASFIWVLWTLLISHTIRFDRCAYVRVCGSLLLCSMIEWSIFRSLRLQNNRSLETWYNSSLQPYQYIAVDLRYSLAFAHRHLFDFVYFNCQCKNYRIHPCRYCRCEEGKSSFVISRLLCISIDGFIFTLQILKEKIGIETRWNDRAFCFRCDIEYKPTSFIAFMFCCYQMCLCTVHYVYMPVQCALCKCVALEAYRPTSHPFGWFELVQ